MFISADELSSLLGWTITQEQVDILEELAKLIVDECYADSLEQELYDKLVFYLVAHYASGIQANVKTERIGPTYVSYDSQSLQEVSGNPLSGTRWGQAVMALDPNGCIANGSKMRATVRSYTEYHSNAS